jgi:CRP/FNR family transcriptional regulator
MQPYLKWDIWDKAGTPKTIITTKIYQSSDKFPTHSAISKMETLHSLSAFSSTPGLLEKLYEFSIIKNYAAGSIILDENNPIRSIPIVTEGCLRVIRTDEDGRELLLYYIKAGESCIMSFLGGLHNEKSKVRAEVEEDAQILFLSVSQVPTLIRDHPQWLDYIFRLYHKRFEELLETVQSIAFKRMDERLMNLLITKSKLTGHPTLFITHEQLANEPSSARAVVSRLLKKLEDDNLLKLGRNKITLL